MGGTFVIRPHGANDAESSEARGMKKTFRLFVNDRPRGKYSGYRPIEASDAREAVRLARERWQGVPKLKAIAWPPDARGQAWLDKYAS